MTLMLESGLRASPEGSVGLAGVLIGPAGISLSRS